MNQRKNRWSTDYRLDDHDREKLSASLYASSSRSSSSSSYIDHDDDDEDGDVDDDIYVIHDAFSMEVLL